MLEERVRSVMPTSSTSIISIANCFQYFSVDWAETFSPFQNRFGCSWKTSGNCVKNYEIIYKKPQTELKLLYKLKEESARQVKLTNPPSVTAWLHLPLTS